MGLTKKILFGTIWRRMGVRARPPLTASPAPIPNPDEAEEPSRTLFLLVARARKKLGIEQARAVVASVVTGSCVA